MQAHAPLHEGLFFLRAQPAMSRQGCDTIAKELGSASMDA
jgi:hypothetical protein